MRRPRVKIEGEGFYHVVSRIGGKRFLLDDAEKAVLLGMIRGAATFSGVELYTFAIMDNHFHLLVRVPGKRDVADGELLRRMRSLYGPAKFAAILEKWEKWEKKDQSWRVEDEKMRLRARMYDLSQFCKTFKEAYTQDYNRRHDNTGTIWEGRFKSVLLQGAFRPLMAVGAYIHLNPVRAEVATVPEDAPWTGYGASVRGDPKAKTGLRLLVGQVLRTSLPTWEHARRSCSAAMEGRFPEKDGSGSSAGAGRFGLRGAEVFPDSRAIRARLRARVAGFLQGGIVGETQFVQTSSSVLLPERARRRSRSDFDEWPEIGLDSFSAARGAS